MFDVHTVETLTALLCIRQTEPFAFGVLFTTMIRERDMEAHAKAAIVRLR